MEPDRIVFQQAVYGKLVQAAENWKDLCALCLDLDATRGHRRLSLYGETSAHLSAMAETDPEEALQNKYRPETWQWGLSRDLTGLLPEKQPESLAEDCVQALLFFREIQPDLLLLFTTVPEMTPEKQAEVVARLNGTPDAREFAGTVS